MNNALRILQWNIRHWSNNRYNFLVKLSSLNIDVVLLNETSTNEFTKVSIPGYLTYQLSQGHHSGVSLSVKQNIKHNFIYLKSDNILAIKIQTILGDLVISTAYVPPREPNLPTIDLHHIFNFNCPVLLLADLNAVHPFLLNCKHKNSINFKGNQIFQIAQLKNLKFIGPHFDTFITSTQRGKPDVIIANNDFNIFHHNIEGEKPLGSDHLPVILNVHSKPIKTLKVSKPNYKKLDINKYKEKLSNDSFTPLDGLPVAEIDNSLRELSNSISSAAKECCPSSKIIIHKSYKPTLPVKLKLNQYQCAYTSWCNFSFPPINIVNINLNYSPLSPIPCRKISLNLSH